MHVGNQLTTFGNKFSLHDTKGFDNVRSFLDLDMFVQTDVVVIVFENALTYSFEALQRAYDLNKPTVIVRNKVENIDDGETDWETELRNDEGVLQENLFWNSHKVFGVSARNIVRGSAERFEWDALRDAIFSLVDSLSTEQYFDTL